MTPPGIETATFRFVVKYLNHCATISGPQNERVVEILSLNAPMQAEGKFAIPQLGSLSLLGFFICRGAIDHSLST
jgi:hypothetical protein